TVRKREPWDGRTAAPQATPLPIAQTAYSVSALDPRTGDVKAKVMQDTKTWGLLSTAGGLVFGGNQFGDVFALDGRTLQPLWTFNVGTAIQAPPMTFSAAGKQYVAVLAGGTAGTTQRMFRPSTRFFTPSNFL